MSKLYCTGSETNLEVKEIEGKAWHDNDLYEISCTKCKKTETQLARRPSDILVRCRDKC